MTKFDEFLKGFLKESPTAAPSTATNGSLDFTKLTPQQQNAVKTALTTNKSLLEIDPKHPLVTQLAQQQTQQTNTQNKPGMTTSPVVNNQTPTPSNNAANKQTI